MARCSRLEALGAIIDSGLVPIFHHGEVDVAIEAARACLRGGARVLEFTHRGDFAHRVFEDLRRACDAEAPSLVLGVGSIRDPHTAALYLASGADFVVGPVFHDGVARLLNGRKVPYIPGCATPTEVARAEESGCEIVKVFPGDGAGGPDFIRAVRGPAPWSSLMPTGGVDLSRASIGGWIEAGAVAVGIGSALISKALLDERRFDEITRRTRQALEWLQELRS